DPSKLLRHVLVYLFGTCLHCIERSSCSPFQSDAIDRLLQHPETLAVIASVHWVQVLVESTLGMSAQVAINRARASSPATSEIKASLVKVLPSLRLELLPRTQSHFSCN